MSCLADILEAGTPVLEGVFGDQFKFTPIQKYFLTFFWAVLDVAGDILYCADELFDRDAGLLLEDGPIPLVVLKTVSIISIVISLLLMKWRLSYMKEMGKMDYNLTYSDDIDVEDAIEGSEKSEETSEIKFGDLEGGLQGVNSLDSQEVQRLKAEIKRLKLFKRTNTEQVTVMEKKVSGHKRIKHAHLVKILVDVEKGYSWMTLLLEDAPQLAIAVYVLTITKRVTVVSIFSILGAVIAAALALYRALNLVAYHLTKSQQEKALRSLYKNLGGKKWVKHRGWLEDIDDDHPLGKWEGVEVDADGQVVALHLNANELTGNFEKWASAHLRHLPTLRVCDVGDNLALEGLAKTCRHLTKYNDARSMKYDDDALSKELGQFTQRHAHGDGEGEGLYVVTNPKAFGLTVTEARQTIGRAPGFSLAGLKDAGFTPVELKDAGFTPAELKGAGFALAELNDAGFSLAELKDAGFTLAELKRFGFTLAQMRGAGFHPNELREGLLVDDGFTTKELKLAGFTAEELKRAGFGTAEELKGAGFTLAELKGAGFHPYELQGAGFTTWNLKRAGFTAAEISASSSSPAAVTPAVEAGSML
jgi:uncharacterized protein YjbI with pentapeptide repeats